MPENVPVAGALDGDSVYVKKQIQRNRGKGDDDTQGKKKAGNWVTQTHCVQIVEAHGNFISIRMRGESGE